MGRIPKDAEMETTLKRLERRGIARGTKKQMDDWYGRLIFMPVDEVRRFSENERVPVICSVSAKALLGKKGFTHLTAMQERLYGKPTEHTDITTGGNPLDNALSRLTASQLDELIDKLAKDDIRSDRR